MLHCYGKKLIKKACLIPLKLGNEVGNLIYDCFC